MHTQLLLRVDNLTNFKNVWRQDFQKAHEMKDKDLMRLHLIPTHKIQTTNGMLKEKHVLEEKRELIL